MSLRRMEEAVKERQDLMGFRPLTGYMSLRHYEELVERRDGISFHPLTGYMSLRLLQLLLLFLNIYIVSVPLRGICL